ncbi:MAG TPA: diacylglycerol kinase family protein [Vicinamibacterales bacterium]|nr:diacylglycerol kinase family protein [Vicinamibacterales bacterium]
MVAIVLNPTSGVMQRPGVRQEIDDLFREAGIDAHVRAVANPDDTPATARAALDTRPAALIAAGGDGTVSAVAGAVAGSATPMGVLPLGTLNHFAKDAGIPIDLKKAVQTIAAGHTRQVDVGRVNDRIFVNNASLGVYPSFVESRDRFLEQGRWKVAAVALAMADVLRREGEMVIRLEGDSARVLARTPFVFVGNNEYLAEGLNMGGRSRLDAGTLFAYYAPPVRTRDLPKLFGQALFGRARRDRALRSMATTEMWVETFTPAIRVACDGEVLTLESPLHCQSWPRALTLFCPVD